MDGETVGALRASIISAADEFVDRLERAQSDLGRSAQTGCGTATA